VVGFEVPDPRCLSRGHVDDEEVPGLILHTDARPAALLIHEHRTVGRPPGGEPIEPVRRDLAHPGSVDVRHEDD
jgi:hypothetical protein